MRVIPVLDIRARRAVLARGGDRRHYPPLRTVLHDGSDPLEIALAYHDRLGLADLYLADLDAIAGHPPDLLLYRSLLGLGLTLWIDAGVRDARDVTPLMELGVSRIILGLECLAGPEALSDILARFGPERLVFSLDLRDGRPIVAQGSDWGTDDAATLAEWVIGMGLRRLILLDLARIGEGGGVGTVGLMSRLLSGDCSVEIPRDSKIFAVGPTEVGPTGRTALRRVFDRASRPGATGSASAEPDGAGVPRIDSHSPPMLEIVAGGGIAGVADLIELEVARASAVLVGSALHDGRIRRADLEGRLWGSAL